MNSSLWSDEQERPIQHLRIIDMTVMLPGPYVSRTLAQYGADVIKIEGVPHGDPLRNQPNTAIFELLNQGKRSVALDLKQEDGVGIVRQLAGEADIFIENFREGVMDRMGLGYAELSEDNPDLLYFSLRGMSGKASTRASHDLNFLAASGVGEWFLENGYPNYSTNFGDIVGGTLVPMLKLMFHIANPARRGMHLVSHMDESMRALYLPRAYDAYKSESLPEENRAAYGVWHELNGTKPHSRYYKCRDGLWISLNAIQDKHWSLFCEVVDRAAWKDRSADPTLIPEIEKLFQDAPSTYWEALVANRDICLFRVVPWNEHISFSQARPQLAVDPLTWAGFAANPALLPSPELGRDTYSVMHSLGITNKEISEFLQRGVIFQPDKASEKKT